MSDEFILCVLFMSFLSLCVCCFPSSLRRAYSWLSFLTSSQEIWREFLAVPWQTSPLLIRLILTTVKSFNISLDMLARHSVLFFLIREKTRSESALLCGRAQRDFMMLDSKGYLSSPVSDLREAIFPHRTSTRSSLSNSAISGSTWYLQNSVSSSSKPPVDLRHLKVEVQNLMLAKDFLPLRLISSTSACSRASLWRGILEKT